jgi:hypothetical protein
MSRLTSSDQETPEQQHAADSVGRNGTPGESAKTDAGQATGTQGSSANQSADHQEPSSLDRVEKIMDEVGKKVGSWTSQFGQHVFRFAAHVREAAEDCWAEAQSIRRGEPQGEQPPEQKPPEQKPPTS